MKRQDRGRIFELIHFTGRRTSGTVLPHFVQSFIFFGRVLIPGIKGRYPQVCGEELTTVWLFPANEIDK